MAKIDHSNCNHPRTPAGRRACRAGIASGAPAPVAPDYIAQHMMKVRTSHAAKARMDREYDARDAKIKMARTAVKAENGRIQPRRSGARVSVTDAGCVQAALHIDTMPGRCACGWHTAGYCYDDCAPHAA